MTGTDLVVAPPTWLTLLGHGLMAAREIGPETLYARIVIRSQAGRSEATEPKPWFVLLMRCPGMLPLV